MPVHCWLRLCWQGGLVAGWVKRCVVYRTVAHVGVGHERDDITQNKFFFLGLLVTAALWLVFCPQPAYAQDPPVIAPTKFDFDASLAPKKCNVPEDFKSILHAWVPQTVLRDDAERRLVVRIKWLSTGGKRAGVSLMNAEGATIAQRQKDYSAATECHYVLWKTAYDAAEMMGAFEPPPPKEPVICPPYPTSTAAPLCPTCPLCPACPMHLPAPTFPPALPRFFAGLGAFVGSGIFSKLNAGPLLMLGFVPLRRLPELHLELESAWTSQTIESINVHSIPLVSSACWVRGVMRFCGGLATTFLSSNQLPIHEMRLFSHNVRIGTKLFRHRALSIRADVFMRFTLTNHRLGESKMPFNTPSPIAGGAFAKRVDKPKDWHVWGLVRFYLCAKP